MPTCTILGVPYFRGSAEDAVQTALTAGLVVVPSAPVIVRMQEDRAHRQAILEAGMALPDSGLMVLGWKVLTGEKLVRISGLEYLKLLLDEPELRRKGALVWIMPTDEARDRNLVWLRGQGHETMPADCYVAPKYTTEGELDDPVLLQWLEERKPQHVILAVGGGVQERLGLYLKNEYKEALGIHCVGAAIGFLSGEQVTIPAWADRLYLGWFFRCVHQPRRFIPRYYKAIRLIALLRRYRADLPPMRLTESGDSVV